MKDFLNSLKSDLLDRRFLPILALVGVALIAAVAYAVLGSGSSTSSTPTPRAASSSVTRTTASVAISQAPANPNQAVAETTSGASKQHSGHSRNPFTPLPGAKKATSSGISTGASKGSSSSGTSTSKSEKSTSGAGGTTPVTPSKPTASAKPRIYIHYHVTAQFGIVPAPVEGSPPQPAQLKDYTDMALNEPLPSKENPQLVFLGVVLSTGKDAAFGLTGEAILHGSATCKPSPTQCQAITLQAGQSETLEVVSSTGQATTYELKLISIAKSVSSAATARAASRIESKIERGNVLSLAGLRYSPRRGGLVFVRPPAFAARARAHAAGRHHRR
jgi:hypothetical protein